MRDATQGWTFSTTVNYASALLSAEWIEEAPSSSAGVLPLADFVTTTFDPTVNAGSAPNINSSDVILHGVDACPCSSNI
jgi:hypothetical protein